MYPIKLERDFGANIQANSLLVTLLDLCVVHATRGDKKYVDFFNNS